MRGNMTVMQEKGSLQATGARTSDWIGQIKGGILYAYDLGTLVSERKEPIEFTKEDFDQALKKVSRKVEK
jgi:hypothetical protein